jgi:hypothetical protein
VHDVPLAVVWYVADTQLFRSVHALPPPPPLLVPAPDEHDPVEEQVEPGQHTLPLGQQNVVQLTG